MRIGIDAKWYYSGPPSGVNVVRNLVDNIIECNSEDEITIFLSSKDTHFGELFLMKVSNKKNIFITFIPGRVNFLTNLFIFPFYFYKKGFDVILFQNYIPFWGGGKTKYVDYVHDFLFLDYPQYFRNVEKLIYRFMLFSVKKAHHVITISQSESNRIIKHSNISLFNISYVYHGLDPIFYERSEANKKSIKKKYNLPEKYVLFVGRINVRKNIKTLLKSFSIINHKISLVIVGKEENKGFNFEKEVANLGIKDQIYMMGHVPDNDLAEIFSGATLFVFPSYAEGFGLPPLEAMKSGVPTIVSNRMALPEVCGDAALIFDVDNYVELAEKIDFLLNNLEAYSFYKMKGINKSQEFTWDKSAARILEILRGFKNE